MKTASEYRKLAEECRALANQMTLTEQRDQLLKMAKTWDDLADTREELIRNHPEMGISKGLVQEPSRIKQ
jgi:chromosome segregation ATPase